MLTDIQAHLAAGMTHYEARRFREAEAACRTAIAIDPGHADGYLLLGMALAAGGSPAAGMRPMHRTTTLAPDRVDARFNQALLAFQAGDRTTAARGFRICLTLEPFFIPATTRLAEIEDGSLAKQAAFRRYGRAHALAPALADPLHHLVRLSYELDRKSDAVRFARAGTRLASRDPAFLHNVASALAFGGEHREAADIAIGLLRKGEGQPSLWNTLANARLALDDPRGASAAYRIALALDPGFASAHRNFGKLLHQDEQVAAAITRHRRALALEPDDPESHFALAVTALTAADWRTGWVAYESRWQTKVFGGPQFTAPRWAGEPFPGRRLVVHWEQGIGDTIHFARYLPRVAERGGEVVFQCQPSLVRLLAPAFPTVRILPIGAPLPEADLHVPLMSLPYVFDTSEQTIPGQEPYLFADPAERDRWRRRLGAGALKIGVTWQGNPNQEVEPHRSIALQRLEPILAMPGCRFFALQKEFGREQLAALPSGLIEDLGPELTDFADTAAAIAELDLVISTCTSVAHLSGALGRPTWVLLKYAPDWRWLLGRDDSPWYPSVRLFRQRQPRDWAEPVVRLAEALKGRVRA